LNENTINEVERRTVEVRSQLNTISFNSKLIFVLYEYYKFLLNIENEQLIQSYLPEFIEEYTHLIKDYTAYYKSPEFTLSLIKQTELLTTQFPASELSESLSSSLNKITNELNNLRELLNGGQLYDQIKDKLCFPLIEESNAEDIQEQTGILETVTIKISRAKNENKFLIVPSETRIEQQLKEQINVSWQQAIIAVKRYVKKIAAYHEVVIHFDKRVGFYRGNSLGIALTISFIEELLKHYNSPIIIRSINSTAITGGVNSGGELIGISKEIIKKKVDCVFFSPIQTFVVPESDMKYADEQLKILKEEFPNRELQIIGISSLNDLLDRRSLINIKKQKLIIRSGKFVKKNWVSAAVAFLLTIIFSYLFVLDFDDNPFSFTVDTQHFYVKNRKGKVLWVKKGLFNRKQIDNPSLLTKYFMIVDINDDGKNEVIITNQLTDLKVPKSTSSSVVCFNNSEELIWQYSFKDEVISKRERLSTEYDALIVDTTTFKGEKNLVLFVNNSTSFSSAIFRLNLSTGERLPGTLWCSGHTTRGIIEDLNHDGQKDVLCVGLDNGYEDAVFFGYNIDNTTIVRPSTDDYLIKDFSIAKMISYIRIPKTDYDILKNYRTPGIESDFFKDDPEGKYYQFIVYSYLDDMGSTLWYQVNYNLIDVNIIVDNRFRVMRDSLVAHGKLPLPYTDTPEYVNQQKSKILYWNNSKWVKREELEN